MCSRNESGKNRQVYSNMQENNGYTRVSLAEKLGITDRAVSKWENGKNMPDASIMLELCELLRINVNELLKRGHIIMDNYEKAAEENLVEMKKQEEKTIKKIILAVIVFYSDFVCIFCRHEHWRGFGYICL